MKSNRKIIYGLIVFGNMSSMCVNAQTDAIPYGNNKEVSSNHNKMYSRSVIKV